MMINLICLINISKFKKWSYHPLKGIKLGGVVPAGIIYVEDYFDTYVDRKLPDRQYSVVVGNMKNKDVETYVRNILKKFK